MKRSKFFKVLGLGLGAAVVAPKLIADAIEEVKAEPLVEKMIPLQDEYYKMLIKNSRSARGGIGEWYEDTRLHFKRLVTIIKVDKDIEVDVPRDLPLKLHDVVFMADQNFMISSLTLLEYDKGLYEPLDLLDYYDATGNILYSSDGRLTQHIVLTPYNKPKKPFKVGDVYMMMLIGNEYIPGSDKV